MVSDLACNRSPFAPPSPKPIWRAPRPAHKASSAHAFPPRPQPTKAPPGQLLIYRPLPTTKALKDSL